MALNPLNSSNLKQLALKGLTRTVHGRLRLRLHLPEAIINDIYQQSFLQLNI